MGWDSPLALKVRAYNEGIGTLTLETIARDDGTEPAGELASFDFEFQSDTFNMYTALAKVLGAASREQLVELLKESGFKGEPVAFKESAPLPEGVEDLLAEMNFVSQFAAVEKIHRSMVKDGESPARLGGLVRGYANLAMLTRHHWDSSHVAFTARSLLYAERLNTMSDDPRLAQLHRAYALAIAGLHGMALQELSRLPALSDKEGATAIDPAWSKVIEPLCRFQDKPLQELTSDPALKQLAAQLHFDMQSSYCVEPWNVAIVPAALKACPESYGIYHLMANDSPMMTQRQAVGAAPEIFGSRIPRRVAALDGIPSSVTELIGEQSGVQNSWIAQWIRGERESKAWSPVPTQVAEALRKADDQPEPSFQVLAARISAEQFVEVANYLMVSSNAVEYSKKDLVDRFAPLVAGQPYTPFIQSYGIERYQEPEKLAELAGQITVRDPRPNMQQMYNIFWNYSDTRGNQYCHLSEQALWQHDYTLPAMIGSLANVNSTWWKADNLVSHFQRYVEDVRAISPHSPTALRLAINTTLKPTSEQLTEWEERGQSDPHALSEIAGLQNQREDFKAAIRCYDRYYELSPAYRTAVGLAEAYRSDGQEEHWLPALEDYLKQEDYSLGHAKIHEHIALDYIKKGKWADAESHALAAAQTWSAWGLELAGRVYEGLGRWDESEKWIREAVESYPTYSGYHWYFWCRRTGRGDVDAARKEYEKFLQLEWVQRPQQENYPWMAAMLSNEYQPALDMLQARQDYADDAYWQNHMLLLAKHVGNDALYAELTAKLVQQIEEQSSESDPNLVAFYKLVLKLQQQGQLSDEEIAQADKLFDEFGPLSKTSYCYFFGEQLALHGDSENAQKYWRIALDAGQYNKYNATLAGYRLAELNGTSRPDTVESTDAEAVKVGNEDVTEAAENSL
jgi:tetratricopeptide (TPR) repeat protein